MSKWICLNEVLTDDFLKRLELGQTLGFRVEDEINRYKVVRVDRKRNRYWAKPVILFTEAQALRIERKMRSKR